MKKIMKDVQNMPANVSIPINLVGIKKFKLPLIIENRNREIQHTIAVVELGVSLSPDVKGTHMSRFVEILENWDKHLTYSGLESLLNEIKIRLNAKKVQASFCFHYFISKKAPASEIEGLQGYDCCITGKMESDKLEFFLDVTVPVITVCPCSKAISSEGAHSQRADIHILAQLNEDASFEEFIAIAESSGSSPTYPILKRQDEKFVTENSFANPCFVEDVVRNVAQKLSGLSQISWFRVEVESYESIHSHNAFAWIEKTI